MSQQPPLWKENRDGIEEETNAPGVGTLMLVGSKQTAPSKARRQI